MKLKKFLLVAIASTLLAGCDFPGGGGEKTDPKLYHLTFSSNLSLTSEQKTGLKATYGFGEPSLVVTEGVRDQDEINALKEAGATDADIEKAGKRQDDGSYYFFSGDPIYLEAPKVTGYKLDGFYNKATGELEDRATVLGPSDNRIRTRWNMDDKNTELEARYNEIAYTISFDDMDNDESNPNASITDYSFTRDGADFTLKDATTTNTLKTFAYWEYQDISFDGPDAPWIKLEGGKLPCDYELDYMRIHAHFECKQFKVGFKFKEYINSMSTKNIEFDDAIMSMSIKANLATVDGVKIENFVMIEVDKNSVIEFDSVHGWVEVFYTLNPQYSVLYFEINGVRNDSINASYMDPPYVNISACDFTDDSIITFVLELN